MILLLTFENDSDRDKFEYLYNKYKNLVLHKAYEVLQDYSLAEDAASEAYLRVYKNLHKIEDPGSGRSAAFLVTIVKNVALTMLQKEKKHTAEIIDEAQPDDFDLEQHTLSELSTEGMYGLVEELSDDLRSVFLLKFAYDLSHKEIGRILGITENNVTVRLHRAKKKLSTILQREGYVREA